VRLKAGTILHIAGTEVAKKECRRMMEMLALVLPIIITVTIIGLTLGISFICVEMVLRFIGRGLRVEPAPVPVIRRPINRPMTRSGPEPAANRRGYRLPDRVGIAA
jgi:hypothetical protein